MSEFIKALLQALVNTTGVILVIAAIFVVLTLILGPFILILALDGPTWAGIAAGVWGIVAFIFAITLVHELDTRF